MTLNDALEAIKLRKKQEMVNYRLRTMEYDFGIGTMTLDRDTFIILRLSSYITNFLLNKLDQHELSYFMSKYWMYPNDFNKEPEWRHLQDDDVDNLRLLARVVDMERCSCNI